MGLFAWMNSSVFTGLVLIGFVSLGIAAPTGFPEPLVSQFRNVPNPFDSRLYSGTVLSYQLLQSASVELTIYDLVGYRVRTWHFSAGEPGGQSGLNSLTWDGTNEAGQKVAKGGYIARLQIDAPSGNLISIRKIGVIH